MSYRVVTFSSISKSFKSTDPYVYQHQAVLESSDPYHPTPK